MIKIFKSLKNNQKNTNNVYAVVNGVSFNLEYVDDNVFSKKVGRRGCYCSDLVRGLCPLLRSINDIISYWSCFWNYTR